MDVHPPQAQPFRAEFDHWSQRRGYTAIMGEIQGEAGTHVWVTFDPADPSQMLYECTEAERVARATEEQLEAGRAQFNAIAEPLEPRCSTGAPAEALIVLAEDPACVPTSPGDGHASPRGRRPARRCDLPGCDPSVDPLHVAREVRRRTARPRAPTRRTCSGRLDKERNATLAM